MFNTRILKKSYTSRIEIWY